ncbi:MAG: replicative DNA helicase [Bacteroides sp.]|nr:replicative DNA helicase [Prevotella sp.]MCM1408218.1 replicative DNA helicase [Treponema brennaborense]MCM1469542.1 replicative DNA helicase [Bacteroides sp.]
MSAASLRDKVPPHNLEAEQATLGALLLDWEAFGTVVRFLRAERFYSLQNQKIFSAMLALYNRGIRGDIMTLIEELRTSGELEAAGGSAYITALTDTVPTSANVEYYARIVLDQSIRRELIRISSKIILDAHDETAESYRVLEDAQKYIFELTDAEQMANFKTAQELVTKSIDMIEKIYKNKGAFSGVPTGFEELDTMTSGFQSSEMIIIGARPSMGKTALALSMAQHTAIEKRIPTAFFSLEMSDMQIMQRLIAQEAKISSQKLRKGRLTVDDFTRIQEAAGRMYDAPLFIVDSPNMKLLDLRAMARRLRSQEKIEIIFIDYIGLIDHENKSLQRFEQVSEISRSLKSLARELNIPVVALCQVRRDSEGKQPTLADLRDSGSIEQDADVVLFLHRDRQTSSQSEEDKLQPVETQLILSKQRNGPTGVIDILFLPIYTKFVEKSR